MIKYDRCLAEMGIIHIGNTYIQYEKKKCNHFSVIEEKRFYLFDD